jgi:hypothetical protein
MYTSLLDELFGNVTSLVQQPDTAWIENESFGDVEFYCERARQTQNSLDQIIFAAGARVIRALANMVACLLTCISAHHTVFFPPPVPLKEGSLVDAIAQWLGDRDGNIPSLAKLFALLINSIWFYFTCTPFIAAAQKPA